MKALFCNPNAIPCPYRPIHIQDRPIHCQIRPPVGRHKRMPTFEIYLLSLFLHNRPIIISNRHNIYTPHVLTWELSLFIRGWAGVSGVGGWCHQFCGQFRGVPCDFWWNMRVYHMIFVNMITNHHHSYMSNNISVIFDFFCSHLWRSPR